MTLRYNRADFARATPAPRGFVMLYHLGETNHCPGCGGKHWHVGRASAQCAYCETALPLALAGGYTQGYELVAA